MLSLSAADETELENWRSRFGRCQLSPQKMRSAPALDTALERLPQVMSVLLRARLRTGGAQGALRLDPSDVTEIERVEKMTRRELMIMLLDIASALAQTEAKGEHIGAIAEGRSGALYVGAPLAWKSNPVRFSVHGVQAAVLNAFNHEEKHLASIVVETQPCACCRQFLRELSEWKAIKLLIVPDGPLTLGKSVKEMSLNLDGLRADGIKARLMNDVRHFLNPGRAVSSNDLIKQAIAAASSSYAPYSQNYAGVALRTKRGATHQGSYVEIRESVAGVLAVESALVDLALGGGAVTDISEIILVETRGTVTQFSATQKLAQAMGNIPFRFVMAT